MFQQKIIDILEKNYSLEIIGVCIYGSRATTEYSDNSDLDLFVVVKENTLGLQSIFLKEEKDVFIECFIFDLEDLSRIKDKNVVDSSSWDGIIIHWLQNGVEIIKDTNGLLRKTVNELKSYDLVVMEDYKKQLLQIVSRELECVKRYYKSEEEDYQSAFIIKFNYLLTQSLVLYCALRNIPWWGEKNSLIYLKKQDKIAFDYYRISLYEINKKEKMLALEQFLKLACVDGYELFDYSKNPVVTFKDKPPFQIT